jgi:hypothetical protein
VPPDSAVCQADPATDKGAVRPSGLTWRFGRVASASYCGSLREQPDRSVRSTRDRGFPQIGPPVRFVDWDLSTDSIVFFAPVDTVEKRRVRRSDRISGWGRRVDDSRSCWGRLRMTDSVPTGRPHDSLLCPRQYPQFSTAVSPACAVLLLLLRLVFDPVRQLGDLVENTAPLGHQLPDLAFRVHDRGVVAAAELLADLR